MPLEISEDDPKSCCTLGAEIEQSASLKITNHLELSPEISDLTQIEPHSP